MITDEDELRPISEKIIGAAFRVHSKLGGGFLEKCYENAWFMTFARPDCMLISRCL
jgi:GxxExxY protein